jgi:HlyD family secretion protein
MRKFWLPLIALVGALLGLAIAFWSTQRPPTAPILFPPPTPPYEHFIYGSGLIEASSQNISIGTPFNEIITKIFVVEGDFVKQGDILFTLDLRAFEADLAVALANLGLAQADFEDKKTQFSFYVRLTDKRAVSEAAYQAAQFAMLEAAENVKVAEANVLTAQVNIDRSIIRSPIDAKILQVNLHVGEIAPISPFTVSQAEWQTLAYGSMLLLGDVNPLQVRIDIDEVEAWRYQPGSRATAFVRGNSHINFPLTFRRVEPYVVPKSSFTGETVERVDTRVLQVLYTFDKGDLPVFTGLVLDVYIESPPFEAFVK